MERSITITTTKEELNNKKLFILSDLRDFVKSKNYRHLGPKNDIIKRVWWILHPDSMEQPPNMALKSVGRPSKNKNNTHKIEMCEDAKCKEDLKSINIHMLKLFIDKHNYRSIGSKSDLIDRVWWIMNSKTITRPLNIDKKSRGRPALKKNITSVFTNTSKYTDSDSDSESCDNDDDDYDTSSWDVVFIKNDHRDENGKKYFKYKRSNYLFKETFDNDYVPYGYIGTNNFVHVITDKQNYTEELKQIIQAIDY